MGDKFDWAMEELKALTPAQRVEKARSIINNWRVGIAKIETIAIQIDKGELYEVLIILEALLKSDS